MSGEFILDYLSSAESLLRIRAFFRDFNGLQMGLFDGHGNPQPFAAQSENNIDNLFAQKIPNPSLNKRQIPEHSLGQATLTKAPVVFKLEDGYLRILIPIVCLHEVVGFLCVSENPLTHLQPGQLKSVVDFLLGAIETILEKEIKVFADFKGSKKNRTKKVFSRIIRYIINNYHSSDLNLEGVSRQHNISYHYLCRLFPQELNMTFSSFLTNTRLNAALNLLKDKSLTVSQISYSCGFEDPGYFSKVFKRLTGIPPAAYRHKGPSVKKAGWKNRIKLYKEIAQSTL